MAILKDVLMGSIIFGLYKKTGKDLSEKALSTESC